jgi:hypothetical protein
VTSCDSFISFLILSQPSKPILRILNFGEARVSVFPEVENAKKRLAGLEKQ